MRPCIPILVDDILICPRPDIVAIVVLPEIADKRLLRRVKRLHSRAVVVVILKIIVVIEDLQRRATTIDH